MSGRRDASPWLLVSGCGSEQAVVSARAAARPAPTIRRMSGLSVDIRQSGFCLAARRRDRFVKLAPALGAPAGAFDGLARHRDIRALAREEPMAGPALPPPCSQELEELRRQHDVAVFLALPLLDPQDHSVAVNGGDRQAERFGDAQTGRIAGGQNHPMVGQVDGIKEADDFLRTEHDGERLHPFRDRQHLCRIPRAAERDVVQEAQSTDGDDDRPGGQPALVGQVQLVGADLLGAEAIRRLVERYNLKLEDRS